MIYDSGRKQKYGCIFLLLHTEINLLSPLKCNLMVDSLRFNLLLTCLYPGLVLGGGEGEEPREGDSRGGFCGKEMSPCLVFLRNE